MDKNKILDIIENIENKSNKDLLEARSILETEFDSSKELIINLTRHLESIEEFYNKINKEIGKRNIR